LLDQANIQAFVISLPHATARRAQSETYLNGNIVYEIIDAIAGKDIAGEIHNYCKSLYCPRFFRDLTLNEVACSLSHGKALRRFLESGARYGLILEDDSHIEPTAFVSMARVVAGLPNFDILKIGSAGPKFTEGKLACKYDNTQVLAVTTFGGGAFAYVVTREGAEKILHKLLPIRETYDAYLRNLHVHRCHIFETAPHLAGLHELNDDSTIGGGREGNRYSPSITQNISSALFRLEYNIGRRIFNLRRFGISYLTKSGFMKALAQKAPLTG
jgi:glycosyl transferase family 25